MTPALLQRDRGGVDDDADRAPEHLLAVHAQVVAVGGRGLGLVGQPAATRGDLEQPGGRAVAAQVPRDQARTVGVVAPVEDDARRAVTEQDAGAAIVRVHRPG